MKKYSKERASEEEAVNSKITTIEKQIEPALYEDAPKKIKAKDDSQKKLGEKSSKKMASEDNVVEKTLNKL